MPVQFRSEVGAVLPAALLCMEMIMLAAQSTLAYFGWGDSGALVGAIIVIGIFMLIAELLATGIFVYDNNEMESCCFYSAVTLVGAAVLIPVIGNFCTNGTPPRDVLHVTGYVALMLVSYGLCIAAALRMWVAESSRMRYGSKPRHWTVQILFVAFFPVMPLLYENRRWVAVSAIIVVQIALLAFISLEERPKEATTSRN
jgi:hypothetical protein